MHTAAVPGPDGRLKFAISGMVTLFVPAQGVGTITAALVAYARATGRDDVVRLRERLEVGDGDISLGRSDVELISDALGQLVSAS